MNLFKVEASKGKRGAGHLNFDRRRQFFNRGGNQMHLRQLQLILCIILPKGMVWWYLTISMSSLARERDVMRES